MTVALWHILVVLALLASNAATFLICKQRIEELKAALLAKKVLLVGADGYFTKDHQLLAGETLSLEDTKGNRLDITSRSSTLIDVKVYPA